MSALILLGGAVALTAALMVRVALRRSVAQRPLGRVPVTLASWSDDQQYQLASHLQRKRR